MTRNDKNRLFEKVMGYEADSGEIENLFCEGSECFRLWLEICRYEECIREKLGGDECEELEKLWSCYERICRLVSLRMFDYGVECAGE